jgi:excinuclease ABC subunit C
MGTSRQELHSRSASFPDLPGVYLMKDARGEIIYVGKASSLKKRVASYFQKNGADAKTRVLVKSIADLEYIVTDSEIEALLLESSLIKKHKPRYNVRLKDDKRYPYIAITLNEAFPRVIFTRSLVNNGNRYFGPYTDARAARKLVSMISNTFKLKTCTREIPLKNHERSCLNYQMNRCTGVCRGEMSRDDYLLIVQSAGRFLEGHVDPVIEDLQNLMARYAGGFEYEKAARVRDMIEDIHKITESQKVFTPIGADQDFVGIALRRNEALLLLFEFRSGVLLGRKVFVFENTTYSSAREIVQVFLVDYYQRAEVPGRIVVPLEIEDRKTIAGYLTSHSSHKVSLSAARTVGEKATMGMVNKNIDILVAEREARREHGDRERGLLELKGLLGMKDSPEVMECFDVSNIQGRFAVASMVRFKGGLPDKKNYRRYRIRAYDAPNDPGMIHEVVGRRLQYLLNEGHEPPDLVVIDGGKPQLSRAIEARDTLKVRTRIIALAKQLEEIHVDSGTGPLRLEESSAALKIIQHLRDEAHRFAVGYHRKLRDAHMQRSILDSIPKVGERTKKLLLRHLKEPGRIGEIPLEELESIPGLGKKTAARIYGFFHG